MTISLDDFRDIFPVCAKITGPEKWQKLLSCLPDEPDHGSFPDIIGRKAADMNLQPWLPDLAEIELALHHAAESRVELGVIPDTIIPNPTLSIIETDWRELPEIITGEVPADTLPPTGGDIVLVWIKPETGELIVRSASGEELLALKIVVEELGKREVADSMQTSLAVLDRSILLATSRGLLIAPPPAIRRDRSIFTRGKVIPDEYLAAETFTLQWHITQACDLHCRHCYDRSDRSDLTLDEAVRVLDQLYDFCSEKNVHCQVSFTGGNPLLHPQFMEIYQEAADRGMMTAILGNPASPDILERICTIQKPEFYQVSLEGLEEHNDHIRGSGHYARVFDFLAHLRASDIYSMVMLTLTRDNLDQVLPLAEILRDHADLFTFNRLSMVGEGADLLTPTRDEYESFLKDFLKTQKDHPVLALKDNLINIIRDREGKELFGGCAGFGCGAAFNFVALLPDGEVHACRKFPSPIGNLRNNSLADIYDSSQAEKYRKGPAECCHCQVRHVCGGCLAVISSQGLDIARDRDPCCFIEEDRRAGS